MSISISMMQKSPTTSTYIKNILWCHFYKLSSKEISRLLFNHHAGFYFLNDRLFCRGGSEVRLSKKNDSLVIILITTNNYGIIKFIPSLFLADVLVFKISLLHDAVFWHFSCLASHKNHKNESQPEMLNWHLSRTLVHTCMRTREQACGQKKVSCFLIAFGICVVGSPEWCV